MIQHKSNADLSNFIQLLLARIDIVALIQNYIPLTRSGVNYTAKCPFHNEKTASFSVNANKQFYYCFGCKKHGDAIGFLMDYQNLTFMEALKQLADSVAMELPKLSNTKQLEPNNKKLTELFDLLEQVKNYYYQNLKSNTGKLAVKFLQERKITGQTAKLFQLGFAPDNWDNLLTLQNANQFSQEQWLATGMLVKNDKNKVYPRFRNRLMFPIRNRQGKVIGFGGRVLDSSLPKYLNSPQTDLFSKSHVIYGLYEALQNKTDWQAAIIVEGYFDVITLAQNGIMGALATMGTAISEHHIKQIFRYVNEVIFCFDGDNAGRTAALKAIETSLPLLTQDKQVSVMFLPKGNDPDDYVKQHGKPGFMRLMQQKMPLSEVLFTYLSEKSGLDQANTIEAKAKLTELAKPLIAKIPDGTYKSMLYQILRQLTQNNIVKQYNNSYSKPKVNNNYSNNYPKQQPQEKAPVMLAIANLAAAIIIIYPKLAIELFIDKNNDLDFKNLGAWFSKAALPGAGLLISVVEILHESYKQEIELTQDSFFAQLKERGYSQVLLKDAIKQAELIPKAGVMAELNGAILQIKHQAAQKIIDELIKKARFGELSLHDKEALKKLLQFRELN